MKRVILNEAKNLKMRRSIISGDPSPSEPALSDAERSEEESNGRLRMTLAGGAA